MGSKAMKNLFFELLKLEKLYLKIIPIKIIMERKAALDCAAIIRNNDIKNIKRWKYFFFPAEILYNIKADIKTINIIKEKSLGLENVDIGTLTPSELHSAESNE